MKDGQVKVIPVGLLQANCILIQNPASEILYIVDPGGDADQIVSAAKTFCYQKAVILFTHAHLDHISGAGELARALKIEKAYLHFDDQEIYESPENHLLPYLPRAENLPSVSWPLRDPGIEVIELPGHTPGGVGYYFKEMKLLLAGDTLFRGSVGRTDLPGGNYQALMHSIRERLFKLPDDLRVICGHGEDSSIAYEKQFNPYCRDE